MKFIVLLLLALLAIAFAAETENPTMRSDLAAIKKIIGSKTYDQVKWKQHVSVIPAKSSSKPKGTVVMISQCQSCPNGFKANVVDSDQ